MKNAAICFLAFALGVIAGYILRPVPSAGEIAEIHDTVRVVAPEVMVVRQLDTIVERFAVVRRDTVSITDTVEVLVPIVQKEYSGEGYRAYVSGYRPALDSIFIDRSSIVVKERRWSVGIQGGVGMTPAGVQPYIGVGISFRIL